MVAAAAYVHRINATINNGDKSIPNINDTSIFTWPLNYLLSRSREGF